ncbi:Glyoxylase, beta-lactamase superfamily II [Desulfatibacillum alkenivorans DSM 16219]|jgi:glyoxylase-like metal-dependent hydrolase (beta-lactamase superfamily II)|uniref:Glyoxylase, beta-lactamase superfamily II n=1 Tax=Desulfatibacillum alkenivorans DSM 16219 TaxID=1121393 RepID=A0A1M6TFF3_9BACT|nr:MBL fold metallo-hydrolase [Desulfatibacillum alkenivorans]SHK55498.1 Glyoxylase, beta-lactamase superfamily II [Desulfatibacillum alkenivorans DSM 16219]
MQEIIRLRTGFANVWLLKGTQGYLMVDAGLPGKHRILFNRLKRLDISPEEIRLVVITHVHFDHAGNLAAMVRRSGCPVIVHEADARDLARGRWQIPDGTIPFAKAAVRLGRRLPGLLARATGFEAVRPDITIESPMSLASWGFDADVLPTPGHTAGSISVMTHDGHAMVGDLAYNEMPRFYKRRIPPFGNDPDAMKTSWALLRQKGAKTIYPGHGAAFDATELD